MTKHSLMLTFFCLQIQANGFSQQTRLSIKMDNVSMKQLHLRQLLFAQQNCGGDQIQQHRKQHGCIVAAYRIGLGSGAVQPTDEHGRNIHGTMQEYRHPQIAGAEVDCRKKSAKRCCKHALHQHTEGCRTPVIWFLNQLIRPHFPLTGDSSET